MKLSIVATMYRSAPTAGISLEYMDYNYPEYPQPFPPYDPQVSVLDLLFMTGPDAAKYIWPAGHE